MILDLSKNLDGVESKAPDSALQECLVSL